MEHPAPSQTTPSPDANASVSAMGSFISVIMQAGIPESKRPSLQDGHEPCYCGGTRGLALKGQPSGALEALNDGSGTPA